MCDLSEPTGVVATDDIDALVPLEQACAEGDASLYVNGIDPGYSGDAEVFSLLSLITRASSITVQEIFDYANYDEFEYTGTSM